MACLGQVFLLIILKGLTAGAADPELSLSEMLVYPIARLLTSSTSFSKPTTRGTDDDDDDDDDDEDHDANCSSRAPAQHFEP